MTIPSDFLPIEGEDGLYYKDNTFTANGEMFTSRQLRADDYHCFYDNTLLEERIYMEQCFTKPKWTSHFTCISREEWIKIAKDKDNTEIA